MGMPSMTRPTARPAWPRAREVDGDEGGDPEERPVRQAREEAGADEGLVGRGRRALRTLPTVKATMSPTRRALRGQVAARTASSGAPMTTPAAYAEIVCPAEGMVTPTPAAISGSRPIVTNSVVPMATPPRIRAMVARVAWRGWGTGRAATGTPGAHSRCGRLLRDVTQSSSPAVPPAVRAYDGRVRAAQVTTPRRTGRGGGRRRARPRRRDRRRHRGRGRGGLLPRRAAHPRAVPGDARPAVRPGVRGGRPGAVRAGGQRVRGGRPGGGLPLPRRVRRARRGRPGDGLPPAGRRDVRGGRRPAR